MRLLEVTSRKAHGTKANCSARSPRFRPSRVWAIRTKLQVAHRLRDLALFNLAIDSKLRGCDLVNLKVEDIAPHGFTLERACVRQRKTGHPVKFELSEQTREAIDTYMLQFDRRPGQFLFAGRGNALRGFSTRQYARLLAIWTASIGLDPRIFGTHSLRRTKAALIYRRTGNLRAVQLLLGHTKIESTVRYLGIEVDDALTIARLMSEVPGAERTCSAQRSASEKGQERTCRLGVNQRPVKVHYPNCGHGAASCGKCGG